MFNHEVGKSYLSGTATSASAVEFIKFRRTCADFFLNIECPRQGFHLENLQQIKAHLETHEVYRSTVTGSEHMQGAVENKWQSSLVVSSQKVLRLMEDCHYLILTGHAISNLPQSNTSPRHKIILKYNEIQTDISRTCCLEHASVAHC